MKKIILVESEPTQVSIYRHLFQKTDFDIELAAGRDEMLEELRDIRMGVSSKPDLVILDFMLADGHGIDVLKAIKKHALTKDIPVFALTNYANPHNDAEIRRHNITPERYMIKAHHTPAQVLTAVNEYLGVMPGENTTLS
jgi:CheY-like chemotaxis protein